MFNMLEKITPDIILLDVEMSGENGLDALRRLKASEQANIPVILFTGTRDEEVEKTGFALGAAGFLEKPFSLRSMLGYVALQLDE
jgi:putative two-component system response regulator